MLHVTKQTFLESRQCLTRGWYLHNHGPAKKPSDADTFRMEQGQGIGRLARLLYPSGVLVEEQRPSDAVNRTTNLLSDLAVHAIFEGTFLADGCVAKADILTRTDEGWTVTEVKSKLAGGIRLDDLVDDLAYTVMVAQSAGLMVDRCCLLLVSRDYRKGMPPQDLFVEVDATSQVEARLPDFREDVQRIREMVDRERPPEARLTSACRGCEYFKTKCVGQDLANPITEIPRLRWNRLDELAAKGIDEISAVPDDFPLSESQRVAVNCVKNGREYVGSGLADDLAKVEWPVAYLDFETVGTPLPLYPDVAPYEQITTQFSAHICDEAGHVIAHQEYLADPARDCRRELTEKLIKILEGTGSIIVYHASFERGQLDWLARLFPDLASSLKAVIHRLFDLKEVILRSYYHPGFRGSFSIKRILPVLVPDLSYDGLPVGDGDTAMSTFARMAMGQFDGDQVAEIRQQLLDYCKLDTLAMVELHRRLLEISKARPERRKKPRKGSLSLALPDSGAAKTP